MTNQRSAWLLVARLVATQLRELELFDRLARSDDRQAFRRLLQRYAQLILSGEIQIRVGWIQTASATIAASGGIEHMLTAGEAAQVQWNKGRRNVNDAWKQAKSCGNFRYRKFREAWGNISGYQKGGRPRKR